ncbi:hypothetical protein MSNKSG1_06343 [Marinobacter santoriniensis NKSG1]|uniref:Uncharacterized protein n=1 Tax=Marinobacter santoriniensis NKSG1 TaxID=1288826 RepID=M7D414_9GAMM|nr:hypothetical protein MSNKSG1_06343 [Marinobacter santoriniensis NKSG1]
MSISCFTESEAGNSGLRRFENPGRGERTMKKSAHNDSQADAVAAVLLIVLAVAFAVVWVSGQ